MPVPDMASARPGAEGRTPAPTPPNTITHTAGAQRHAPDGAPASWSSTGNGAPRHSAQALSLAPAQQFMLK